MDSGYIKTPKTIFFFFLIFFEFLEHLGETSVEAELDLKLREQQNISEMAKR